MSEQKTCLGGGGVEEATIVVSGENKPSILIFFYNKILLNYFLARFHVIPLLGMNLN